MSSVIAFALTGLVLAVPASAGVLRVDAARTTGSNDGSSWANAFQGPGALSAALAVASAGDEVWVARGTYLPTLGGSRSVAFELRTGVEIYGGFRGVELALTERDVQANECVLSGDLASNDGVGTFSDNSYHVVRATVVGASAVLDGFTIRGGRALASGVDGLGGGLRLVASQPALRHLRLVDNHARFGGGAHLLSSAPTFEDCTFDSNLATDFGGALNASQGSAFVVRNGRFLRNSATFGGAVVISDPAFATNANFEQCVFARNVATGASATAISALLVLDAGACALTQCTLVDNRAPVATGTAVLFDSSGGGSLSVANSLLHSNTGASGAVAPLVGSGAIQVRYSLVEGGFPGVGNLSVAPLFVDLGAEDYRLAPGSPGIDAGENASVPSGLLLDVAGRPRFFDDPATSDAGNGAAPLVDVGAHEFRTPGVLAASCPGDGSVLACPCANNGNPGNGCANSVFAAGASLVGAGDATLAFDTVRLSSSKLVGSIAIFFQGGSAIAPAVVDDGIGCVGGPIVRLGAVAVVSNSAEYPAAGQPAVSVRGAIPALGGTYHYQCFYRNATAAFCPPATSNRTNGLQITWSL